MLSWLGKFQKGRATYTGIAVSALGLIGQMHLAQQVAGVSATAGEVASLVGAALIAFGVGRKAGYHATEGGS